MPELISAAKAYIDALENVCPGYAKDEVAAARNTWLACLAESQPGQDYVEKVKYEFAKTQVLATLERCLKSEDCRRAVLQFHLAWELVDPAEQIDFSDIPPFTEDQLKCMKRRKP